MSSKTFYPLAKGRTGKVIKLDTFEPDHHFLCSIVEAYEEPMSYGRHIKGTSMMSVNHDLHKTDYGPHIDFLPQKITIEKDVAVVDKTVYTEKYVVDGFHTSLCEYYGVEFPWIWSRVEREQHVPNRVFPRIMHTRLLDEEDVFRRVIEEKETQEKLKRMFPYHTPLTGLYFVTGVLSVSNGYVQNCRDPENNEQPLAITTWSSRAEQCRAQGNHIIAVEYRKFRKSLSGGWGNAKLGGRLESGKLFALPSTKIESQGSSPIEPPRK